MRDVNLGNVIDQKDWVTQWWINKPNFLPLMQNLFIYKRHLGFHNVKENSINPSSFPLLRIYLRSTA